MILSAIYVEYKKIELQIKCVTNENTSCSSYRYFRIPFDRAHRNEVVFKRELTTVCIMLINSYEESRIKDLKKYETALDLDYEMNEVLPEVARKFLDANNVTNDEIREAYIDKYVDKYQSLHNSYRVLNSLKYKVCKDYYLAYYLFTDNQAEYDKFVSEHVNMKKKSNIEFYNDLKKQREYLENNYFFQDMYNEL